MTIMQPEHQLYSYTYLYRISNTSTSFIRKMVMLFVSSLDEYVGELTTLQQQQNLTEIRKLLHKMKPSVLNLEVKGTSDILKTFSDMQSWSPETDQLIDQLKDILITIKPLMEKDLILMGAENI